LWPGKIDGPAEPLVPLWQESPFIHRVIIKNTPFIKVRVFPHIIHNSFLGFSSNQFLKDEFQPERY
jgi:hypothetical protein